ncbi:transcription factor MAMYB [Andrographis paniculata]|uniref:transcription factor MAMYB n=1 Tax=Andrographis paniculata TaxID=175694 RepID=UPI0021E94D05|nr:transcription factor MAMYB [Andrographis paniculata]
MEFLDEYESRPRFLFQSKQSPQSTGTDRDPHSAVASSLLSSVRKPSFIVSVSISLVLIAIAFVYLNSEPMKSILLWLALSLLVGPFAPPSLTAGDVRVGLGPPLEEESPSNSIESTEKSARRSTKTRKKVSDDSEGFSEKLTIIDGANVDSAINESKRSSKAPIATKFEEESEWSEADDELLRKFMAKHPVGKPGRWEAIAEGFKGKFNVDTIISKAKEIGERKMSDHQDSFKKFLKDRKPVDKRVLDESGNEMNPETSSPNQNSNSEAGKKEIGWSSAEDLALLNALKTFPKDVTMRWEKIAASVPGKTKSSCMRRVTELKKGYRSSKTSSGQSS